MDVVESPRELQRRADALRASGRRIALVPTMGALHAGHLSLVDEARKRADAVWVSIFVNPMQFDQADEVSSYPRTFKSDCEQLIAAGVDALFPHATDGTVVVGDAANKTQRLLAGKNLNWTFIAAHPTAECARIPARNASIAERFEDVAYFTPAYLKDFQAGKPKDPLGLRKSASA